MHQVLSETRQLFFADSLDSKVAVAIIGQVESEVRSLADGQSVEVDPPGGRAEGHWC